MPTFDVLFQVTVSGVGSRPVTSTGIVAPDAATAIATAQSNLVQIVSLGVQKTAN